ncbi:MAG: DUF5320 domain-containing protein [Candidatus Saelkia tenebricola]|nr:DUF5320 domain-containing protein [Candidatus Saelkia tenebricola]
MPGGDGTGPAGMGSMTGRAAGYCAGYAMPGYMNPIPGRGSGFGRGMGRGRGRGVGMGRGFGWGGAYPSYPAAYANYPYAPNLNPQQEADMLKEQTKVVQDELNAMNERIKELESNAGSQKQ